MLMSGSEELQIAVLQIMHKEQSNNLYSFNLLVAHFKSLAANVAKFLKCVWPFLDVMN